jgi:phosphoadenosine phosphosulfate reductase
MALIEHDLFRGRVDKVAIAIDRMKAFEPPEGYYLAYSGGKDSDTILALAKMAGVKFDAHYNLTTVDPPEIIYHIRKHREVEIHKPEKTMWQLVRKKGIPPYPKARYCCEILKERGGTGRIVLTGIRASESKKRASRNMVESCYKDTTKRYLHPIIDWIDEDVWEFLKGNNISYCKLYDEGWKRLGCVMCPLGSNAVREAVRWPKIRLAWLRSFENIWRHNRENGRNGGQLYKSPEEWMVAWMKKTTHQEDGGLFT